MKGILISLLIGAIAGIIDIIPMVIKKMDIYPILSAFIQWVILGLVIAHIQIGGLESWLKGLIVAVILALPISILVFKTEPKSVIIILIMSVILGSLVGLAVSKFIY